MGKMDIHGTLARDMNTGNITVNKNSRLYRKLKMLTKGQRSLLDFILANMGEGTNSLVVNQDTLDKLLDSTRLAKDTIPSMLSLLKKNGFIDKAVLPYEYIVHPTLAWCGNEFDVYRYMNQVEEQLKSRKKV